MNNQPHFHPINTRNPGNSLVAVLRSVRVGRGSPHDSQTKWRTKTLWPVCQVADDRNSKMRRIQKPRLERGSRIISHDRTHNSIIVPASLLDIPVVLQAQVLAPPDKDIISLILNGLWGDFWTPFGHRMLSPDITLHGGG